MSSVILRRELLRASKDERPRAVALRGSARCAEHPRVTDHVIQSNSSTPAIASIRAGGHDRQGFRATPCSIQETAEAAARGGFAAAHLHRVRDRDRGLPGAATF